MGEHEDDLRELKRSDGCFMALATFGGIVLALAVLAFGACYFG